MARTDKVAEYSFTINWLIGIVIYKSESSGSDVRQST